LQLLVVELSVQLSYLLLPLSSNGELFRNAKISSFYLKVSTGYQLLFVTLLSLPHFGEVDNISV